MRLAFFSLLSAGLHAAALAYPITFASRTVGEAIHVTLLPGLLDPIAALEQGGAKGASPARVRTNSFPGRRPVLPPCCAGRANSDRALEDSAAAEQRDPVREPPAIASPGIETVSDSTVTMIAAADAPSEARQTANRGSSEGSPHGANGEMSTAGNHGGGGGFESGGEAGTGAAGPGTGSAGGKAVIQASYRDAPRPEYPESARRAGQQGRVLLRVLVDERGRSKRVEIHSSSGSEALDRAAAAAIRRWRFDPARYGQQAVESWLRIPVDFRLTDANYR